MKKGIDASQIEKIAKLAHLQLTEEEKVKFTAQLGNILDNFAQLSEVNVDGVEPTTHATEILNVFREDKPTPSISQQDALKNANQIEDGFFKAPRII